MNKSKEKQLKKARRKKRIRAKIKGTLEKPRLNVFRSNNKMFVQLINDVDGKTIISVSSDEIKEKTKKTEISFLLGKLAAQKALNPALNKAGKKIDQAVFDRNGYKYHGRVKALAEGAREGGLNF